MEWKGGDGEEGDGGEREMEHKGMRGSAGESEGDDRRKGGCREEGRGQRVGRRDRIGRYTVDSTHTHMLWHQ